MNFQGYSIIQHSQLQAGSTSLRASQVYPWDFSFQASWLSKFGYFVQVSGVPCKALQKDMFSDTCMLPAFRVKIFWLYFLMWYFNEPSTIFWWHSRNFKKMGRFPHRQTIHLYLMPSGSKVVAMLQQHFMEEMPAHPEWNTVPTDVGLELKDASPLSSDSELEDLLKDAGDWHGPICSNSFGKGIWRVAGQRKVSVWLIPGWPCVLHGEKRWVIRTTFKPFGFGGPQMPKVYDCPSKSMTTWVKDHTGFGARARVHVLGN